MVCAMAMTAWCVCRLVWSQVLSWRIRTSFMFWLGLALCTHCGNYVTEVLMYHPELIMACFSIKSTSAPKQRCHTKGVLVSLHILLFGFRVVMVNPCLIICIKIWQKILTFSFIMLEEFNTHELVGCPEFLFQHPWVSACANLGIFKFLYKAYDCWFFNTLQHTNPVLWCSNCN